MGIFDRDDKRMSRKEHLEKAEKLLKRSEAAGAESADGEGYALQAQAHALLAEAKRPERRPGWNCKIERRRR